MGRHTRMTGGASAGQARTEVRPLRLAAQARSQVGSAPAQSIEKNGMSIKLDKMDGKVHGTIANDLKRFAPAGTFGMTMDMAMSAAGQKLTMHMKIDSEITAH